MEKEKMEKMFEDVERVANLFDALIRVYGVKGLASLTVGKDGYIHFDLLDEGIYTFKESYDEKMEIMEINE